MNKKSYIDLLKYYLRDLPQNVIDDIVSDYEEHFIFGVENGKTEAEISEELGNPELIAEEFLKIEPGRKRVIRVDKETGKRIEDEYLEKDNDDSNLWKWIAIIALFILLSPLIIGVLGGIVGIVFGVFGLAIGLFSAGIGILVAQIFGIGFAGGVQVMPLALHPLTQVLFALFFIALAIFIIMLAVNFIQWLIMSIKNIYISIKWRMERQNEN